MKIVVLISSLQGGGAERVAATLANQFSRMGNEVTIWNRHTSSKKRFRFACFRQKERTG